MELHKLSLTELRGSIQSKKVSVVEVVQHYLDRTNKLNANYNAYIEVNEGALEQAKKLDSQTDRSGLLFGVPVGVKDNFCTQGMKTTAGSRILGEFRPPYTAWCIEELTRQGAIVLGKTNLDEFAMGSSNETSFFGPTRNPWNVDRVPGGSSGGSAACVAARLAPVSVGSDTGGSIRQPASFCGVTGIKPTYGSISRYGMVAFASSLDQAGSFGQSVEDASVCLDAMISKDSKDSTNVKRQVKSLVDLPIMPLKGKKVGYFKQFEMNSLESSHRTVIEKMISALEENGAELVELDFNYHRQAIATYYLIATSEASSNLARYDGVRYGLRDIEKESGIPINNLDEFYKLTRTRGFGREVKRRIMLGTFSLSAGYFDAYYTKACQVRRLIAEDFNQAFTRCDVIIGPVASTTAFPIGEKIADPMAMYYNDIFTTPASLAGLPAMSLPVGFDNNKLPVGFQIMAPSFQEESMISFAKAVEEIAQFQGGANVPAV